jgi:hypothetical protein
MKLGITFQSCWAMHIAYTLNLLQWVQSAISKTVGVDGVTSEPCVWPAAACHCQCTAPLLYLPPHAWKSGASRTVAHPSGWDKTEIGAVRWQQ